MRGTKPFEPGSSPNQKTLGLMAEDAELSPINPHGEPVRHHGSPGPAVAAA